MIREELSDAIYNYNNKNYTAQYLKSVIISIFEKHLQSYLEFVKTDKSRCAADKTYSGLAIIELIEKLKEG